MVRGRYPALDIEVDGGLSSKTIDEAAKVTTWNMLMYVHTPGVLRIFMYVLRIYIVYIWCTVYVCTVHDSNHQYCTYTVCTYI